VSAAGIDEGISELVARPQAAAPVFFPGATLASAQMSVYARA
jgi:hypothetical protein